MVLSSRSPHPFLYHNCKFSPLCSVLSCNSHWYVLHLGHPSSLVFPQHISLSPSLLQKCIPHYISFIFLSVLYISSQVLTCNHLINSQLKISFSLFATRYGRALPQAETATTGAEARGASTPTRATVTLEEKKTFRETRKPSSKETLQSVYSRICFFPRSTCRSRAAGGDAVLPLEGPDMSRRQWSPAKIGPPGTSAAAVIYPPLP